MTIYHYTSSQGLLGIFNSKSLWATHFEYLNDKTEYTHAKEVITKISNELENESVKKHIETLFICLEQIYKIYDVYTCSFSRNGNVLSQWRAYCPSDGGFSIGFDIDKLIASNGMSFFQCLYTYESKKEAIEPLVIEFCENVEKLTKGIALTFSEIWQERFKNINIKPYYPMSNLDLEKNHIFIKYELALLAAEMKDEAFIEEDEFRYIYISDKRETKNINYRTNGSLLIPYRSINWSSDGINQILIGPSVNQNQNKFSIELLKESNNMTFEILESKTPYRG